MIMSLKWHRPFTKRTSASVIRQLLAILTTINFEEIDHFEAVFLLNIDKNATSFISDFNLEAFDTSFGMSRLV